MRITIATYEHSYRLMTGIVYALQYILNAFIMHYEFCIHRKAFAIPNPLCFISVRCFNWWKILQTNQEVIESGMLNSCLQNADLPNKKTKTKFTSIFILINHKSNLGAPTEIYDIKKNMII